MRGSLDEAEFRAWEAQQPLRFGLADGRPVRLPDEGQGRPRVARVRHVAVQLLPDEVAVDTWMASPQVTLGGLEPKVIAEESERGCQLVLRTLVTMSRLKEVSLG
jgi:uncharacterized protein (DUF2384 family)